MTKAHHSIQNLWCRFHVR